MKYSSHFACIRLLRIFPESHRISIQSKQGNMVTLPPEPRLLPIFASVLNRKLNKGAHKGVTKVTEMKCWSKRIPTNGSAQMSKICITRSSGPA